VDVDFGGKIVLVTGGGGGIGRAACVGFAERGATVVVVDRDAALGQGTVDILHQRGTKAQFVAADVASSADVQAYVKATVDAYGRIDCFFNNAGIEGPVAPITEYDDDAFDRLIGINLRGVFLGLKYVLRVMLKQGSGAVVNTASIAGLVGGPGMAGYVASKHAVIGLTRSASADVARFGLRVNAVCPGPVETRMMRSLEALRNPEDPESVVAANRATIPSGRYATPEEVANLVIYLCSDMAGSITGSHMVIDGGRTGSAGSGVGTKR
jgi:NAD(P)-dependent dehydrogenase (short-subunit alcohol dehydrogenase family)